MRALVALAAVLVVALTMLFLFLGPDEETEIRAPEADSPATAPSAPAAPEAKPVPVRRPRAAPTDDVARPDDDDAGEPFFVRFHVVSEADGTPIAGAEIRTDDASATTDASGDAALRAGAGNRVHATVRARGFAPQAWRQFVSGDLPTQTVELRPGVIVPVEVVDAATGRPLQSATVTFAHDDAGDEVTPDAAGRGDARLGASSSWAAYASAAGHLPAFDVVRTAAIGEPQPTARFALVPAGTLRGVVTDPDGKPVAEADVSIRFMEPDDDAWSTETDDAGAYVLDGIPFGTRLAVRADGDFGSGGAHGDSAETKGLVPTSSAPVVTANLRLRRRGTLTLTALDGNEPVTSGVGWALTHEAESGRTIHRGAVEDLEVPAGRYEVTAWADERIAATETVEVPEGGRVSHALRLSAGDSVSGVVLDDAGEAVYDARVEAAAAPLAREMRRPSARTDAEGRFTLTTLPRGGQDVRVVPPWEYEPLESVRVSAPSENVRLVVRRRGTLSVRVVLDDDARPAADARLSFDGYENGESWHLDRPLPTDGRLKIAWPAERTGTVSITVEGFQPVMREVTVPLGAAADLGDVPLRAGLPLTGVLRDENGRAFGRATLVASCPGGLVSARTAADGSFAFRGLPAGTLRIDAMTAPRASFTVDVPRAARAELVVPDAGRLLVWVTGAAGSPVAGRSVWARDADGQIFATDTTGRDGMASLRLVPGRYTVFEESGASAEAEVRTDEHTRLRLASR